MFRAPANRQTGFSIVELVVVLTIMVLVLLALFALYENYGTVFASQQSLFNIAGSASASMNELQQDILQADAIVDSRPFNSGIKTSGANSLVLELPAMDSSGNLLSSWDYVAFYVSGNKLYRELEATSGSFRTSGVKQLSDTVSSLTFTYDNADPALATKVDLNITTQSRSGHITQTYQLQQQVYLRND